MVTWTLFFQNHILEEGLTQNTKTMALFRMFTTIDLFELFSFYTQEHYKIFAIDYFLFLVQEPTWIEIP